MKDQETVSTNYDKGETSKIRRTKTENRKIWYETEEQNYWKPTV